MSNIEMPLDLIFYQANSLSKNTTEIVNKTQKTKGENINVAIKRKRVCERAIERKIWLTKF
jgi:hypothetical protein